MKRVSLCLVGLVTLLLALPKAAHAQGCGLPGPDQVIIYQDRYAGGACRVLAAGNYPTSSSFGLPNDSISALDVGSAVRAALYKDSNFRGPQAHFEGGFYYDPLREIDDNTSSIEVFPRQGGPAATFYLGNYPSNRENFWSQEAQGLANNGTDWFLAKDTRIFKAPLSYDLNSSSSSGLRQAGIPTILGNVGYNHFGDPDQHDGFLFVPLEASSARSMPRIAVFSTVDLRFLSSDELSGSPNRSAPWVAIRPGSRTLWVSVSNLDNTNQIREYDIDWTRLEADGQLVLCPDQHAACPRSVTLRDRDGSTLNLKSMQGGVFNPEGTLLYISTGYIDAHGYVRVFAIDDTTNTATLQAQSENAYAPFNFETHPSTDDEAEGLDWLDVRGRNVPGIPNGQLHLVMIDNDPFDDDLYLKHYSLDPVIRDPAITASCRTPGDLVISPGDTFEIVLAFSNDISQDVSFTTTMKANAIFGPEHIFHRSSPIGKGLESRVFLLLAPTTVGRDQITLQITSDKTGSRVLAECSFNLEIRARPSLGLAGEFNVFILGDLTQSGTQTRGRLAVGGNAILNNYRIGEALPNSRGGRDDLIVGGTLTFNDGVVVDGNVVSGGAATLTGVSIPHGRYRRDSPVDFSAQQAYLRRASNAWSRLTPNGQVRVINRSDGTAQIILTGDNPGANIFALSGRDLAAARGLFITAPPRSTVLVNIDGTAGQMKNLGFLITGVERERVLYNFYQATEGLTLSDNAIQGSILAPFAPINFEGRINGILIGASLTGAGAAYDHSFMGNLPDAGEL